MTIEKKKKHMTKMTISRKPNGLQKSGSIFKSNFFLRAHHKWLPHTVWMASRPANCYGERISRIQVVRFKSTGHVWECQISRLCGKPGRPCMHRKQTRSQVHFLLFQTGRYVQVSEHNMGPTAFVIPLPRTNYLRLYKLFHQITPRVKNDFMN